MGWGICPQRGSWSLMRPCGGHDLTLEADVLGGTQPWGPDPSSDPTPFTGELYIGGLSKNMFNILPKLSGLSGWLSRAAWPRWTSTAPP